MIVILRLLVHALIMINNNVKGSPHYHSLSSFMLCIYIVLLTVKLEMVDPTYLILHQSYGFPISNSISNQPTTALVFVVCLYPCSKVNQGITSFLMYYMVINCQQFLTWFFITLGMVLQSYMYNYYAWNEYQSEGSVVGYEKSSLLASDITGLE